eukprot:GEMP01016590.1.p1 GENE.GEMP01016590.1~~GEMP01016590.1.p1  ORF type:complete len:532 (+),score=122.31 GEMP01016590.1:118-1713(+)
MEDAEEQRANEQRFRQRVGGAERARQDNTRPSPIHTDDPAQELAQLVNSFLNSRCLRENAESKNGQRTNNNASGTDHANITRDVNNARNVTSIDKLHNANNGKNLNSVGSAKNLENLNDVVYLNNDKNLNSVSSAKNLKNVNDVDNANNANNAKELNNAKNVDDVNNLNNANNAKKLNSVSNANSAKNLHNVDNTTNANNAKNHNNVDNTTSANNADNLNNANIYNGNNAEKLNNVSNNNDANLAKNLHNSNDVSNVTNSGTAKNSGTNNIGNDRQFTAQPRTTGQQSRQPPSAQKRPPQLVFLVPALPYNNDRRMPTHATRSISTAHNTPSRNSNGEQKKRGNRRKDDDKPKNSPVVHRACAPRRKLSDPLFPLPKTCQFDAENTAGWAARWSALTTPTVRKGAVGTSSKLRPGSRFDARLLLGSIITIGLTASRKNNNPVEYGVHLDVPSGVYFECRQPLKVFAPQMPRIGDVLSIVYHQDRSLSFEKNSHTIGTVESPQLPKESSAYPCDIDWQPFVNTCVDAVVALY